MFVVEVFVQQCVKTCLLEQCLHEVCWLVKAYAQSCLELTKLIEKVKNHENAHAAKVSLHSVFHRLVDKSGKSLLDKV